MIFFDRTNEIATLLEIEELSHENAQFTIVTGRRRIGKTALVLKAYEHIPIVYFFISRKPETELCIEFQHEIENKTGIKMMGQANRFVELFEGIMNLAQTRPITLFIDEFQEFLRVNPSVFSEMQRIWDLNHNRSNINLVVCGSVSSLISKIFTDRKEPLYNRQTRFMRITPFKPNVLKEIMGYYHPDYTSDDLLTLYTLTGGVAKYVQLMIDSKSYTRVKMLKYIFRSDSVFLPEGKSVLIEEFGNEHTVYFAILAAIASGKTKRNEIEETIGKEVGGYLSRLENDYNIITRRQPLFEKTRTKNVRYFLNDNFFSFWFRFIYRYSYMLEVEAYDQLLEITSCDFDVFSGVMLERYFREMLTASHKYTRIGGWWDRKGENEIDIIAVDEINRKADFYEVKRNPSKISLSQLQRKVNVFMAGTHELQGYSVAIHGLSMDDM